MIAASVPVLALAAALAGQVAWFEPFPAHRVMGNVYHVGSKDLASYLITTPEGHILINSGFERTVPLIRTAVESLGFKMADIKILLASHAHSDHVAGHALMREQTGAKVYVMRGDDRVIASGGEGQYLYRTSRWKPCPVDRVLEDGDKVNLGGVTLVARRTPGHTRGCTTWTWRVEEDGKPFDVVVIGSPNVNPGYRACRQYRLPRDRRRLRPHLPGPQGPSLRRLPRRPWSVLRYDREIREAARTTRRSNPFVDPNGYRAYVALKEKAFRDTLAARGSN